jgi:hypothetical protein
MREEASSLDISNSETFLTEAEVGTRGAAHSQAGLYVRQACTSRTSDHVHQGPKLTLTLNHCAGVAGKWTRSGPAGLQ